MNIAEVSALAGRVRGEIAKAVVGQTDSVDLLLTALFAGGHVLLEGPPGTAKTLLAQAFAATLGIRFGRVQFTPDLMPGDIIGANVFNFQTSSFSLTRGPIFCDLLLADEINRTPPKTQAALLEAMQERQVTLDGVRHPLGERFMVVATQNPIEHEGTFPLPEAQMDRFLLHLSLGLPHAEQERAILDLVAAERIAGPAQAEAALSPDTLAQAKAEVATVHLAPALKDFIVRLVMASRPGGVVAEWVEHPVSPRGTLALAAAAQALAWLKGRDYGLPEDVIALAPDALAHRLVPTWAAVGEGRTGRSLVADILKAVEPW